MRQLVYTMLITNNLASFHFWGKESLVKSQKVLKYFFHNYFQNFLLFFIFLLIALIVKKRHFGFEFTLSFQKQFWTKLKSLSIANLDLTEKIRKVLIKQDKTEIFFQLSLKSLIVTEIVQKCKTEGGCGELETKNYFQRKSWKHCMRQTIVFI